MNYTDLAQSVLEQAQALGRTLRQHNNVRIRESTSTLRRMNLRPWRIKTIRCTTRLSLMRHYARKIQRAQPDRTQYSPSGIMYYPPGQTRAHGFHLWRVGLHLNNPHLGPQLAGWHLECAALIQQVASGRRWIWHYGGKDLAALHHPNEAHLLRVTNPGLRILHHHTQALLVRGEKMSKSKGNVYRIGGTGPLHTLRNYLARTPMQRTLGVSREDWLRYAEVAPHPIRRISRRWWGLWCRRCRTRQLRDYRGSDRLRQRLQSGGYLVRDGRTQSGLYPRIVDSRINACEGQYP